MNDRQLKELLEKKGTPLYLFDAGQLRRRVQTLRQALPSRVRLC